MITKDEFADELARTAGSTSAFGVHRVAIELYAREREEIMFKERIATAIGFVTIGALIVHGIVSCAVSSEVPRMDPAGANCMTCNVQPIPPHVEAAPSADPVKSKIYAPVSDPNRNPGGGCPDCAAVRLDAGA